MGSLATALEILAAGRSLSAAECRHAVDNLLDGSAQDTAAAAFLTALKVKGETPDELDGAVQAVRQRMLRFDEGRARGELLDTCGTGGDRANTVNLSTASALVVAACGTPVAKHGNRAASSASGSSDVLTALGVAIDPPADILKRCLNELNIAFLFAPRFHPGLAGVAAIRRQLPFRTLFNLVGPLCNPASPPYQLVGVPHDAHAELVALVLSRQSSLKRAVVVTGSDGLDEVTLVGPTSIRVVERGAIERDTWYPEDFGLTRQSVASIGVASPLESAMQIERVLAGDHVPARAFVLANSAAALHAATRCSLAEGVARAARAIDSGAARQLLARWTEIAPAGVERPCSSRAEGAATRPG
jgi:anthranilate phosphoribosyltransferase